MDTRSIEALPRARMSDALKKLIAQDSSKLLERVQAKRAESSLLEFIKLCWPVLEPGRKFKEGRVVSTICEHLEAVAKKKIKRLNINVPPGCMKSLTTSVFWPAWVWGPANMPWARFVAFAYSEDLTIRDNKKMRALIESDIYQRYWGDRVKPNPKEWGAEKIANLATGFKLATSIGGVGTGERGDFIIIDDPHNVREGESDAKRNAAVMWFGETLPTRVNDQEDSPMVMIMQRVHEADVSGFVLENLRDEWEHLCLPMRHEPDHPYKSRTSLGFEDWRTEDGELLWPDRFPETAIAALEKTFRAAGGDYACNPAEAPVLMSDLSMRPISHVRIGDELIGFVLPWIKEGARDSRNTLTRCQVLDVFKRTAPVVKVTLDSGEVIRCTADHHWFKRVRDGENIYSPATIGSPLTRVCPPRLPDLTPDELRMGGWLGGFFDGDGSVSSCEKRGQPGFRPSCQIAFYQGFGRNAPNCEMLERVLEHFGFQYSIFKDERKDPHIGENFEYRNYRIISKPCLATFQKFIHVAQPVKWRDRLLEGVLRARFAMGKERVVSIEPDGEEMVYSLRTTTGNYVVWGLMSSNCAGQLQQRPAPREGGMFKRESFQIIEAKDVPSGGDVVRGWDLAATKDGRAAYTVGLRMRRVAVGDKVGYYIETITRGQWSPHQVDAEILKAAREDGRNALQDIPQDPGQAGKSQVAHFAKLLEGYNFVFSPESGSKEDRARPFSSQVEAGNVYLVRAPWNGPFLAEAENFPNGRFKDQVDAASRAYAKLIRRRSRTLAAKPEVI